MFKITRSKLVSSIIVSMALATTSLCAANSYGSVIV